MKIFLSLILAALFFAPISWLTDFEKAKTAAVHSHKKILLNFSGSDWCIPCIRLRDQIFQSAVFTSYADSSLVLVNADFPRLKKNKLSAQQTKLNESLADTYNPHGSFPLTLLLDADGKVLKQWEGFPNMSADQFVHDINAIVHGNK